MGCRRSRTCRRRSARRHRAADPDANARSEPSLVVQVTCLSRSPARYDGVVDWAAREMVATLALAAVLLALAVYGLFRSRS